MSATPSYGDPEREAWGIVQRAIEEAMDIDDLRPYDRGKLALMHGWAGWYVGEWVPVIETTSERLERLARELGPRERVEVLKEWLAAAKPWSFAGGRILPAIRGAYVEAANQPGGIGDLGLDKATFSALAEYGVTTIAELEARIDGGDYIAPRVGPKRLRVIRAAVERWEQTHEREATR